MEMVPVLMVTALTIMEGKELWLERKFSHADGIASTVHSADIKLAVKKCLNQTANLTTPQYLIQIGTLRSTQI